MGVARSEGQGYIVVEKAIDGELLVLLRMMDCSSDLFCLFD